MKYFFAVVKHKWFVFLAGLRVGNIPLWRLVIHDISKFYPSEFRAYKKRFVLGECPSLEWKLAWHHHVTRNPHHWEHWLIPGEVLPMSETYIREMVADWLGAGRSYHGSWDIQAWICSKFHSMILHPQSVVYLRSVLKELDLVLPPR